MDNIISIPGLQHLAEIVFRNLDVDDLKICAQINQSCKQILEDAIFWLRKFCHLSMESQNNWIKIIQSVKKSGYEKIIISYLKWNLKEAVVVHELPCFWFKKFRSLSRKNQMDWIKVIELEKSSEKDNAIMSYLIWNLKKEHLVHLPLYSDPVTQDLFRMKITHSCLNIGSSHEETEIVKILAPLTDNPNTPDKDGDTPIHHAALEGHTEIIKILAPLTDNPNVPNKTGVTPIYIAAHEGHTDIVKILAPLSGNNSRKRKLDLDHQRKKPRNLNI